VVKEKTMENKIKTLNDKIAQAHLGGGEKRIAKQHEKKKLPRANVSNTLWMKVLSKKSEC